MGHILKNLTDRKLLHPPKWLVDNTIYLTIMGSQAYGVSGDKSDFDVYGCAIPPRHIVFPHLSGTIKGFGNQGESFDQFQQHHVSDETSGTEYDFSVYSIIRLFQLCMENNPNMLDCIFTPQDCVLHMTQAGQIIRDNRRLFLHKGSWIKFKGYAYSQLHKISNKTKEVDTIRKFEDDHDISHDTKFNEVEQIMKSRMLL